MTNNTLPNAPALLIDAVGASPELPMYTTNYPKLKERMSFHLQDHCHGAEFCDFCGDQHHIIGLHSVRVSSSNELKLRCRDCFHQQ